MNYQNNKRKESIMGCWNATCALTHLPIFAGEPVVMLMLASLDVTPGQCHYYNDDASPFALPIQGKYNDYGGLEDVQMSDATRQLLRDTTFYTHEKGEYVPVSLDSNDENELLEMLWGDCLYIKYPFVGSGVLRSEFTLLSCVMYHKEAYELVQNEILNRETANGKGKYGEALSAKIHKNWERNQNIRARYTKIVERFADGASKCPDNALPDYLMELYTPMNPIWGNFMLGYKFVNAYETTLTCHSELDPEQFMTDLVEMVCFLVGLDVTRRSFYGICGLGSQGGEMYLHKKLAEWICAHILLAQQKDGANEARKDSLYIWD